MPPMEPERHKGIKQRAPLGRRTRDGGESAHQCAKPGDVEPLLRETRPESVCMRTHRELKAEAQELIRFGEGR